MRYHTLTEQDAKTYAEQITLSSQLASRVSAASFCDERAGNPRSPGSDSDAQLDPSKIETLAKEISDYLKTPAAQNATDPQREAYESKLCGKLHASLRSGPFEILDDPRFCQYMAVKYFSEFIVWREHNALGDGNIGTYLVASVESIPLRLFLRASVVYESTGTYDLCTDIPEATDFWRSHILRVRIGRARIMAGALAEMQKLNRLPTAVLRRLTPLVNRMWSNVLLSEYDKSEGTKLLKELRSRAETKER